MLLKDVRNEVGHGIPSTCVYNGCLGLKSVRILFDNSGFPQLVKLHFFVYGGTRVCMTCHDKACTCHDTWVSEDNVGIQFILSTR